MSAAELTLTGITQRFGSVVALDDVSLTVRAGTVHALLGENGAGKSTLMRVAFGMLAPEAGTIAVRGRAERMTSPATALSLGIGMVHQHFTLVPGMTVAENVALGGSGRFDPIAAAATVRTLGATAGLTLDPQAVVETLPIGAQQRCEIVKALARDVSVLILDEPTAVLAPQEAAELLQWMRRFADAGHAVVLITHKLRDALAVADEVTVLRRGRVVYTGGTAQTTQDQLRIAMVGSALADVIAETVGTDADADADVNADADTDANRTAPPAASPSDTPVLALEQVSVRDARGAMRLREVSLSVARGEMVGIAAVEGSGQHELLRLLAGRMAPTTGQVTRPAQVGFVPEDRHRDALLLDAPLDENVALRGAGARRGRMPWRMIREATAAIMAARDVRAAGPNAPARSLSGGNQQKLVLGRELADRPAAVIVENPSRGLDFQATAAVHAALREARDAGAAVVLYSSDLDEVLQLADRVVVLFDGRLVASGNDREAVGRAMLGAT